MNVTWIKSTTGTWLPLNNVNLGDVKTFGIYVIWHEGNPARIVYVGQGDIKDRLTFHQMNPKVQKYAAAGMLRVTWAAVSAAQVDGVERYLADKLRPLVGEAHPNAAPIAVNW